MRTQYSIRPKRYAACNKSFLVPTRVLNANGISIAYEFSAGLTRWQTDRQTDRPRYLFLFLNIALIAKFNFNKFMRYT